MQRESVTLPRMQARIAAVFAHAFLIRLTLIALLVGAAMPVGFMPNPDGLGSGAPIVICTGHGPINVASDDHGKPANPAGTHTDICVFAAAAMAATPVAAPALRAPYAITRSPAHKQNTRAVILATRYRLQAARAPPLAA